MVREQRYNIVFILIWILSSCKVEVDLVAPEARERLVVYGILRSEDSVQYIRLGRLFVTREDAMAYAARKDLNVAAHVTITDGQTTWLGTPETLLKNPQTPFYPVQVVYRFSLRPQGGRRYTLQVSVPDDSTLNVQASTLIPPQPYIAKPETLIPLSGNQYAYPTWNLQQRYFVEFYPQANLSAPIRTPAYELRVVFRYGAVRVPGDTVQRTLPIGPYRLLQGASAYNRYQVAERELFYTAYANLQESGVQYVYDTAALSQAWQLELTALDTALYNYLRVNDPATTDFTTVKPEYTNVQNGLGVFGATNTARRFFRIDACSQYLLRLNNAPQPFATCRLEE